MGGLPIIATATQTWDEIRRKWSTLLKALLLPAIAISVLDAIEGSISSSMLVNLLFWALTSPFYVLLATICHRTVILGEDSLPSSIGLFWSDRETKFFGWTIALIIVSWGLGIFVGLFGLILPVTVLGFDTPWFPLVITVFIAAYFAARLGLVFPATATDQPTSLEDTWYLTSSHGSRIVSATVIAVVPVALIALGFAYLFDDSSSFGYFLVSEVFAYLFYITIICTISVVYRTLAGLEINAEAA